MMRRTVEYNEIEHGLWSITCGDCPIKHHAEALSIKPPRCLGGIATNMQGPIVLDKCAHTGASTVQNEEGNALSLECRYGATP